LDLLDTAALPGFPEACAGADNFALRVALAVLAVYERSRVRAPSTHTQTAVLDPSATIVRQSGRGRFLVVKGPDRGESVPMSAERPVTFGSGTGNDVVLSDPTVSRRHLLAERGEDGVLVRDLGSTNGSYVQGARFKEMELRFGAEIHIGKTVLKYLPEEEVVELPPAEAQAFGQVLGWDPEIRKLFRMLADVAPSEATVLIEGETGTGKELLAEEIHAHSRRSNGPFVVFDCGAVPRELIESALFGHLRGAFTGAVIDRRGAFSEADGGTLFLDEIGELAPEMQPALLRAIDRRMIRPLGAPAYQQLDVRIVAATNRSLRGEVAARRFREDLYYRLAVVRIAVPPLRQRPEDIILLADHFLRQFGGNRRCRLTPASLARLQRYGWPGNVRELRNVIERACLVGRGDLIDIGELQEEPDESTLAVGIPAPALDLPYKAAKARLLEGFERDYFKALVDRHGGNVSAAARDAKIDRKHLRDLLRKLGLRERGDADDSN
jgi:two-component system nitrogen regulation response regulator GlnG